MGSSTIVSERAKLCYVAPRPAGVELAEFRAHWRRLAGQAMADAPWMDLYQQSDTLTPEQVGLPAEAFAAMGGSVEPGGIGMIGLRSIADVDAAIEAATALRHDEIDTFGRELGADLLVCTEHRVIDRSPAPAIGAFGLVHRRPELTHDEFAQRWVGFGPEFIAAEETAKHVGRYWMNVAVEDGPHDGMVEFGFDSVADLIGFVTSPVGEVMAKEAEFMDWSDFHIILGANHVLYSELALPVAATA